MAAQLIQQQQQQAIAAEQKLRHRTTAPTQLLQQQQVLMQPKQQTIPLHQSWQANTLQLTRALLLQLLAVLVADPLL
jgi:hypothetical protein